MVLECCGLAPPLLPASFGQIVDMGSFQGEELDVRYSHTCRFVLAAA